MPLPSFAYSGGDEAGRVAHNSLIINFKRFKITKETDSLTGRLIESGTTYRDRRLATD